MKPFVTYIVPCRLHRWGLLAAGLALGACVPEGGRVLGLLAGESGNTPGDANGALTKPGQGNGSGTVSTGVPIGSEFSPITPQMSALRVKNLLTGKTPTDTEYQAIAQDGNALEALVETWITSQDYKNKMLVFWADAFQQSQAQAEDFHLSLDDQWFTPTDALLVNFRQSFAKTVQALVEQNAPFTEVATTQRFMMTTAMMAYLAYADTTILGDAPGMGYTDPRQNRFLMQNADWNYTIVNTPIPIQDSANPQSANYLKFYIPTLGSRLWRTPGTPDQGDADYCQKYTSVRMQKYSSFEYEQGLTKWLYAALKGDEYRFFDPPQQQPNSKWCGAQPSLQNAIITDADHADWRMVTITKPLSPSAQSKFYDLAGLRNANTLAIYMPRVGYFTTPSFFAQWNTNVSNQARSTANQTLITGLAHAFDGKLTVALPTNTPGLNAEHAGKPACFACHMNLDPMRQFFRQNYTLSFSSQLDSNQTSMPGTFGFDGLSRTGGSVTGNPMATLGQAIADHPRFKIAWAQKLCNWANSTVCDMSDPELIRISEVFAASGYKWQALVKAMFTSPLVTYLEPTQTAQNYGVTAPIARQAHLCAALDTRLGLTDSCGLMTLQNGLRGDTYANLAYTVPKDAYSRGAVDPIYVTAPDLFYRNVVENMCSLAADKVVDTSGPVAFSSSAPQRAVDDLTHILLGLDSSRDAAVSAVLMDHYNEAYRSGASATQALKSTFVLACQSPYMVSIGQ